MRAFEFARALYLQQEHGWARFTTMEHHYNLLAREEEGEMLPLCAAAGVGTMIWSPLARGLLAGEWNASTARQESDPFAGLLYNRATEDSDHAIIDAVGKTAAAGGVSRAQVALAWLRRNPVVAAPLVGTSSTQPDRRRRRLAGHRADRL